MTVNSPRVNFCHMFRRLSRASRISLYYSHEYFDCFVSLRVGQWVDLGVQKAILIFERCAGDMPTASNGPKVRARRSEVANPEATLGAPRTQTTRETR